MFIAEVMGSGPRDQLRLVHQRRGGTRREITSSVLNIFGLKQLRDIHVEVPERQFGLTGMVKAEMWILAAFLCRCKLKSRQCMK